MADLSKELKELGLDISDVGVRLRRYLLDRALKEDRLPHLVELRAQWLDLWQRYEALKAKGGESFEALAQLRSEMLKLSFAVDLVQRDLISDTGLSAGVTMVGWLSLALMLLVFVYLFSHGVRGWDFSEFEPLAEWGPLKYVEVAFWSEFGVLCVLLYQASKYTLRRDFDPWYQGWYITTALRAPFMAVMVLLVVLEFTELHGQGTFVETYFLEEGNKYYFIIFLGFCLGLMSDDAASIMREIAGGVIEFIRGLAQRMNAKLKSVVTPKATEK